MISIALNCTCTANNLFCFHKFITYICQPSYKNRIASILTWKINCLPLSARARFDKTKIYLFSILFYLYFAHFVNEQFNFCRWHKKFSLLYFLFYTTFHHLFKFWNVTFVFWITMFSIGKVIFSCFYLNLKYFQPWKLFPVG